MVTGLVKMMEKCEEDHLVFYNRVRVALGLYKVFCLNVLHNTIVLRAIDATSPIHTPRW